MRQFFTPDIDLTAESYNFNEIESKHIAKVLRKKAGDTLHITNGKGKVITAKLLLVSQKVVL